MGETLLHSNLCEFVKYKSNSHRARTLYYLPPVASTVGSIRVCKRTFLNIFGLIRNSHCRSLESGRTAVSDLLMLANAIIDFALLGRDYDMDFFNQATRLGYWRGYDTSCKYKQMPDEELWPPALAYSTAREYIK